jgi:hypothetical protein
MSDIVERLRKMQDRAEAAEAHVVLLQKHIRALEKTLEGYRTRTWGRAALEAKP